MSKPPKVPGGPTISFEGAGWTESEKGTGTVVANKAGSALAGVLNEKHFGWSLTPAEALKLTHRGTITFSRTGQSCAEATGVATNICWGRVTGVRAIEVYTNAGDVTGAHYWFGHELGHAFEAAVGRSIPSAALQQAQNTDPAFPNRVVGDDSNRETWGFAGTRWTWQQSSSANANEEFADMYLGWIYYGFEDSPIGQMRADFMANNMSAWVDLAVSRLP